MNDAEFKDLVKIWPDFPTNGISFKDVNPLIRSSESLNYLHKRLFDICKNLKITKVAAIEARGFFVGSLLGISLNKGLVLIRKEGKLPGPTIKESYTIEYGTRVMEIQEEAILNGDKILIADDLLATGGTALAAASLVEKLGAIVVGFVFIISLNYLEGPDKLKNKGYKVNSILEFE